MSDISNGFEYPPEFDEILNSPPTLEVYWIAFFLWMFIFLTIALLVVGCPWLPGRIERYLQKIGVVQIEISYNQKESRYLDRLALNRYHSGAKLTFFRLYLTKSELVERIAILNETRVKSGSTEVLEDLLQRLSKKLTDIGVELPLFPQLAEISGYWFDHSS